MIIENNFIYGYLRDSKYYSIQLTQFGWRKNDPLILYLPTIKQDYVLHIVLEGKGYYTAQGIKRKIEKNQGFLILPAERVNYVTDKQDPWKFFWIGITGPDAEYVFKQAGFLLSVEQLYSGRMQKPALISSDGFDAYLYWKRKNLIMTGL